MSYRRSLPRMLMTLIALITLTSELVPAWGQVNRHAMKIAFFKQRANELYAAKEYDEAVRYAQLALDAAPYDGGTWYNMACSAALRG